MPQVCKFPKGLQKYLHSNPILSIGGSKHEKETISIMVPAGTEGTVICDFEENWVNYWQRCGVGLWELTTDADVAQGLGKTGSWKLEAVPAPPPSWRPSENQPLRGEPLPGAVIVEPLPLPGWSPRQEGREWGRNLSISVSVSVSLPLPIPNLLPNLASVTPDGTYHGQTSWQKSQSDVLLKVSTPRAEEGEEVGKCVGLGDGANGE